MRIPLIHGLVMARNEWPLLEVAVTHALVHHVDMVHVLDHASTDGTPAGLARLRREWGDRLEVVHLGECPYLQEAAMSLLRTIVAAAPDDWLYVFDADEFGITGSEATLRDLLADVDPRHDAVRYDVHNWVAPTEFSTADMAGYDTLRHRAAPAVFLPVSPQLLADEIVAGAMNYFDVPFDSKVIVRGSATGWIAAGAHRVAGDAALVEARLPADAFRVAHLPLLGRDRLDLRADQGLAYIANDFPPGHGWQSQMVADVAAGDGLDAFWERHSLGRRPLPPEQGGPVVVRDDSLAPLLTRTLEAVRATRVATACHEDTVAEGPQPADGDVVAAALRSIRSLQDLACRLDRDLSARTEAEAARLAPPAHRARRSWRRRVARLFTRPLDRFRRGSADPSTSADPAGEPDVIALPSATAPPRRAIRSAA